MLIAGIHPLAGFDRMLHYSVPERLQGVIAPGSLVRVPVGKRHCIGVVGELGGKADVPVERLRPVSQAVYPFPAITPDLIALARWMSSYYGAPLESVFETMIPAPVRRGSAFKEERMISPARPPAEEEAARLARRAPQQARLLEFLSQQIHPQNRLAVLERLGIGASSCDALVAAGLVREERRRVERVAYRDGLGEGEAELVRSVPPELNPEQKAAAASVCAGIDTGRFGVHVLQGITGSGKTEVYLACVQRVLAAGGGVIYLVPEVALTPQTVGRLRARLEVGGGHRTVVWHSHLSEGERLDGWMALATGTARVVVGARSAVFAPVSNLRLIVVDEEHEPAYKQDEAPRYHGRDVAVYRARLNNAVCLPGSATPSIETTANVLAGRYRCDRLTHRIDHRRLPHIQVVDMRVETMRSRGVTSLSRPLVDRMIDRFGKREQTILFINRRGYSSSMICGECGHVAECPHCSIALTYHRTDETLRCHLCGATSPAPHVCPGCRSPKIRWRGLGTQRVEEAVHRILPSARVVRMDADTMVRKNLYRQILGDFRTGKIDVLVGTQMIAKGLDFPNVTLVGLVDADLSLHIPDFRANERTFQLIVQVAGRAGRGDRAGEVIVQSFTPQAEAIQFGRHADVDGFLAAELAMRERYNYPPCRHLIHQIFRGPNPEKLEFFAKHWVRRAQERMQDWVELRGPSPAPIERIRGQYRLQVWYFTRKVVRCVGLLTGMEEDFPLPDDVIATLDVDPVNLC